MLLPLPLPLLLLLLLLLLLVPTSALAWNGPGHEVIARIAWSELSPELRDRAVALLLATDRETGPRHFARDLDPRRAQLLFEGAATWPDWVRSNAPDENRSSWHYVNFFWRVEDGEVIDLPERKGAAESVLTELPRLLGKLGDRRLDPADRGVALAWVLHLVGDLHQPLHCSARVTERDPEGDRGGNDFKLEPPIPGEESWRRDNLHSLWDGALTRLHPRRFWESDFRYRERLLGLVREAAPAADVRTFPGEPDAAAGRVRSWIDEGVTVAQTRCYPPELARDRPAPPQTLRRAAEVAGERMLLAGLRLARALEAVL